ncbi:transposase [Paenibacillus alkaliterrae]|uniref:transposase n=1 Tax=Paenibacillus alkaliterrae TaxID=320909 RepID=UPI001F283FC6|nr:transposase [Paenibacillus alkaliterrae]MCF2939622.1 transposase [Paenibacillus alkaliterrae]
MSDSKPMYRTHQVWIKPGHRLFAYLDQAFQNAKMKAHYTGILRQGNEPHEGAHLSRRLERLHLKRHRRIKDLFHKASHHIVKLAVEQHIGTIATRA